MGMCLCKHVSYPVVYINGNIRLIIIYDYDSSRSIDYAVVGLRDTEDLALISVDLARETSERREEKRDKKEKRQTDRQADSQRNRERKREGERERERERERELDRKKN